MAARKKRGKRKSATRKQATRKQATRKKATRKKALARKPAKRKATRKRKATKKRAARKRAAKQRKSSARALGNPNQGASATETVDVLEGEARRIHRQLLRGKRPELRTPQRSLGNVSLHKTKGYLELGRKRIIRTLSVNTVRTFAQTLKFMALSKDMVGIEDLASKREVYYQSINWAMRVSRTSPSPTGSWTMLRPCSRCTASRGSNSGSSRRSTAGR